MRKPTIYLIEELLPAGRVHIFSGPSGSGKTTLLFQWMKRWLSGNTVLGQTTRKIHPNDAFYYISTDRVQAEMDETLDRIGIDPDNLPEGFLTKAIVDPQFTVESYMRDAPENTRVLFIEGAHVLIEGGRMNSAQDVASFLKGLSKTAEERNMAIWLSTGAPKQKKGEEYLNPRERVMGSTAWGSFSSTIFSLALDNPKDVKDPNRTLYVFPRNKPNRQYSFQLDTKGRLIEVPNQDTYDTRMKLLNWFAVGQTTTWKELQVWAASTGVSQSTLQRALEALEEKHEIEHEGRGKYVRIEQAQIQIPGLIPAPQQATPVELFGVKF